MNNRSRQTTLSYLYHDKSINLMQTLGYHPNEFGICLGIAGVGMQAILARDIASYNEHASLVQIEHEILRQEIERKEKSRAGVLTANAFFDTVEIYQHCNNYPELFENDINPRQIDILSGAKLILPQVLCDQGGLALVDRFCGAYSKSELSALLPSLRKSLEQENISFPMSFIISNSYHALTVGYDPLLHDWIFIEVNNGPAKLISSTNLGDEINLWLSDNDTTVISTDIIVTQDNAEQSRKVISEWKNSVDFTNCHNLTSQRIHSTDYLNTNLLLLAAIHGHSESIENILRFDDAPINVCGGYHDFFPLLAAVNNNSPIIVRQLLAHPMTDPNMNTDDGKNSLMHAVICGHTECVRALISHPDIHLNQSTDNDICPLIVAAFKGYYDVVKLLLDAYMEKQLDTNEDVAAIKNAIELAGEVGHSHIVELLEEYLEKIWSPPVMRLSW